MNIFDPFVNRTPLLTMGKLKLVGREMTELKDRVCYLMNNGGGVILFDCERRHREVLPVGSQFTLLDLENEPQKIYQIIEGVIPKVQVGVNLEVSVVPLVQNPQKYKRKTSYKEIARRRNLSTSAYANI